MPSFRWIELRCRIGDNRLQMASDATSKRVFLSWSKPAARSIADALRTFLTDVVPSSNPWFSKEEIKSGERWVSKLGSGLNDSSFAIICVTVQNLTEPWLHFEAGAVAARIDEPRVIPYLCGVDTLQLPSTLQQFQARQSDRADTLTMVKDIAVAVDEQADTATIERRFERNWGAFSLDLERAKLSVKDERKPSTPSLPETVGEIALNMREVLKRLARIEVAPGRIVERDVILARLNRAMLEGELTPAQVIELRDALNRVASESELASLERAFIERLWSARFENLMSRQVGSPAAAQTRK